MKSKRPGTLGKGEEENEPWDYSSYILPSSASTSEKVDSYRISIIKMLNCLLCFSEFVVFVEYLEIDLFCFFDKGFFCKIYYSKKYNVDFNGCKFKFN